VISWPHTTRNNLNGKVGFKYMSYMEKQTLVQKEALTVQQFLFFPHNTLLLVLHFPFVKLMHEKKYKGYRIVHGACEYLVFTQY
jgi:hypothetical protein